MIEKDTLPQETDELKGMIYRLIDVVEEQKKIIANQNERIETQSLKIEEQAQRIDELTSQISALKRHRFGKRSEKIPQTNSEENKDTKPTEGSPDGYKLGIPLKIQTIPTSLLWRSLTIVIVRLRLLLRREQRTVASGGVLQESQFLKIRNLLSYLNR
jgi:hypothetical protein